MAISKICGIETEYGIIHQGMEEFNPSYSSSVLITSYLAALQSNTGIVAPRWDFNDEMPGNDARGFLRGDVLSPELHSQLANAILRNGARYYVDHAHPEMSSPECRDALEAVLYDCAGDAILGQSMAAANAILPDGQNIVIYKNNSDGKGNSYGCHENYLMDRRVPFSTIASEVMPHFITRQIYCGAGKVGYEVPWEQDADDTAAQGFQLTSRADFIEEQIGLETTIKRPIINTRDEPHSDYQRFRRLHVIVGDANMSQVATLLKLGATALVLAMIEDEFMPFELEFENPVGALRAISSDLTLRQPVRLADGQQVTALDIQWEFYERARKFSELGGLECLGETCGELVLERWEAALNGLETDPHSQAGVVDWVAKYRLIDGYRQRENLPWDSPRLKALDLQYHDLRPDKGLAQRLGLERLFAPEEINHAVDHPPADTRAYFRGRCLEKFGRQILAANWDSVVFDVGDEYPRRVSLQNPHQGTEAETAQLFADSATLEDLLEAMPDQTSTEI